MTNPRLQPQRQPRQFDVVQSLWVCNSCVHRGDVIESRCKLLRSDWRSPTANLHCWLGATHDVADAHDWNRKLRLLQRMALPNRSGRASSTPPLAFRSQCFLSFSRLQPLPRLAPRKARMTT